jgi:hypothetical protein
VTVVGPQKKLSIEFDGFAGMGATRAGANVGRQVDLIRFGIKSPELLTVLQLIDYEIQLVQDHPEAGK